MRQSQWRRAGGAVVGGCACGLIAVREGFDDDGSCGGGGEAGLVGGDVVDGVGGGNSVGSGGAADGPIMKGMSIEATEALVREWLDIVANDSENLERTRCRPRCGWNLAWRDLRQHEGIVSGCEVNRLINGLCGECLPAIDLAHVDLAGGEQRPEQHGSGIRRWQYGLRFDPPLELFV